MTNQEQKAFNYLKRHKKLGMEDKVDWLYRVLKSSETIEQLNISYDFIIKLSYEWWYGRDHLNSEYNKTLAKIVDKDPSKYLRWKKHEQT